MTYTFESKLAPYITGLIEQKHADGFVFESGEKLLKRFDTFCKNNFSEESTVTFELAAEWVSACIGQSAAHHNSRVTIVRNLSLYILSLGEDAYVPDTLTVKAYRPMLYIPSKDEVKSLLAEMEHPTSHNTAQRCLNRVCKVLFLLYFCCGLRLSEGRLLKRENVDLKRGIITIISSKGKDRLVYLPQDSLQYLRDYMQYITSVYPTSPWMFPGKNGDKPISTTGVEGCFNRYWQRISETNELKKHPTPHCLRHAYVVERINDWMIQGIDTNKMLPYLSRYLGHTSPDETYYYYHLVEKAFKVIREKDTMSDKVIPEVEPYEE